MLSLLSLIFLGGCASTAKNPRDPLEPINRAVYQLNDGLDKVVLKPVATVYKTVLPQFVRTGVTNFYNNLYDVLTALHNLLQGKVGDAVSDVGRIAINSTVGLAGFIDPVGWIWRNHIATRNSLWGLYIVNLRANLLDSTKILEEAALDPYEFQRDAYLQRRRNLVYDGNPPAEKDDEDLPELKTKPSGELERPDLAPRSEHPEPQAAVLAEAQPDTPIATLVSKPLAPAPSTAVSSPESP
jgi:phospholipid-binding lipoprotein MlaA